MFTAFLGCSRLRNKWSAKLRKCKHKNKRRGNVTGRKLFTVPPPFPRSRTYIFACISLTGHPYHLRSWNRLLLSKGPEGGLPIPFPSHHFFPNPTNQCPDPTDMLTKHQSHSHFGFFSHSNPSPSDHNPIFPLQIPIPILHP